MATKFDNNLRGVLFKNNKEGNEKRPDIRGQCEINGVQYRIAGWHQYSKSRTPFYALQLEVMKPTEAKEKPRDEDDDFNDSIPF
jgi:hypothetical protein